MRTRLLLAPLLFGCGRSRKIGMLQVLHDTHTYTYTSHIYIHIYIMFMYTLFYRKPLLLFWVARRRFYRLKVEADCSLIDSDARRRLLKAQSKLGLGSQTWPFLKSRETPKDVFALARLMHNKCVWILVFFGPSFYCCQVFLIIIIINGIWYSFYMFKDVYFFKQKSINYSVNCLIY